MSSQIKHRSIKYWLIGGISGATSLFILALLIMVAGLIICFPHNATSADLDISNFKCAENYFNIGFFLFEFPLGFIFGRDMPIILGLIDPLITGFSIGAIGEWFIRKLYKKNS